MTYLHLVNPGTALPSGENSFDKSCWCGMGEGMIVSFGLDHSPILYQTSVRKWAWKNIFLGWGLWSMMIFWGFVSFFPGMDCKSLLVDLIVGHCQARYTTTDQMDHDRSIIKYHENSQETSMDRKEHGLYMPIWLLGLFPGWIPTF